MNQMRVTDELLTRYITGEVTATEKQNVEDWIDETDAHRKQFEQLQLIWQESRSLAPETSRREQEAWERLQSRIRPQQVSRRIPLRRATLPRVAALILFFAGIAAMLHYFRASQQGPSVSPPAIAAVKETPPSAAIPPAINAPIPVVKTSTVQQATGIRKLKKIKTIEDQPPTAALNTDSGMKRKGLICNNTPCSIEICIVQSVKCGNSPGTAFSYCSMLQPDQSGHLHYKEFDKITENCEATIDEIRIRRVSTGETIVLNSNSSPATAQDFFHYITGQKKGDIQAGIFESDCNNYCRNQGLRLDNTLGDLVLQ